MNTMSHKGQSTTLEERVIIAERVQAGRSSREIADELERPLATVRKWRQRYRWKGRAGLSSQMGRPAAGALATVSDALLALREQHPGWTRIAACLKEKKKVRQHQRHHQTIAGQAFEGQIFADLTALQRSLQARMLFLNSEYPTRALDGQALFQAFPQSRHSSRLYGLEAEEQLLDMQRVYDYLQSGRWFRQVSSVETFSLGGYGYHATTRFAEQTLEITFDHATRTLIYLPEKSTTTFRLEIQGLTKAALMGNTSALPGYAAYQLALPFACPDTTL